MFQGVVFMINLPFSSDVVGAKFVLKQFSNKLKVKEKKKAPQMFT
jgi:hypothetical protein